jgi:hypothetical protein
VAEEASGFSAIAPYLQRPLVLLGFALLLVFGLLRAFQAGLAIVLRLAKADPRNAGWRRDLILSNVKLAELPASAGGAKGRVSRRRGAARATPQAFAAGCRRARSSPGPATFARPRRSAARSLSKIANHAVSRLRPLVTAAWRKVPS